MRAAPARPRRPRRIRDRRPRGATAWGDTPPGDYRKRRPEDYDRALCLLPRDVVDFVLATQPREWQKLAQHHGAAVKEQFLRGEPADAPAGPQGDGGQGVVRRAGHGTDGPVAILPAR